MQIKLDDIASLGTILGIWAHPDDESWNMAGIMAVARGNGQRVVCVTATAGEVGKTTDEQRWPQKDLRQIRKRELEAALECLGVTEHEWLGYDDGQLKKADESRALAKLRQLISRVQPDSIFTFEPQGITGHDDHKAISRWTVAAAKQAAPDAAVYGAVELREKYETIGKRLDEKFDIYFNTVRPVLVTRDKADLYFALPADIIDKKLECLRLQASQMSRFVADSDIADDVRAMFATEQFIRLI